MFGTTNYAQVDIWHRIPCPSFRSGEAQEGVVWYGSSRDRLISRDARAEYPTSSRYSFSSDSGLIIKGIVEGDEGRYFCKVIPSNIDSREEGIYINVIGKEISSHFRKA